MFRAMTDLIAASQNLEPLRRLVDEEIERAMVNHGALSDTLRQVLSATAAHAGAECMYVRTYGEDLALSDFLAGGRAPLAHNAEAIAAILAATESTESAPTALSRNHQTLIVRPIDVAGQWFGATGLIFERALGEEECAAAQTILEAVIEVLDNHLYSIWAARERHTVMLRLGDALRHRVLRDGIGDAVRVLAAAVPIERLLIVYVAEENATRTLQVKLFEGNKLVLDTLGSSDGSHGPMRQMAIDFLEGKSREILGNLGLSTDQEEVLINGVTNSVVVGKIAFASKHGALNMHNRELIAGFAGFIRQRIVDFNKEWRNLASSFREETVARLLQSADYEKTYLAPREETVGILYVDISGFTRLSEQVLKEPSAVAHFVEAWSEDAVNLVWEHGGVFDKMVGDCIIALFGPPFYEESPGERLAAALRCAIDIRAMTNAFPRRVRFSHLAAEGVAVSTGVHLAPLFVGTFGRDRNFTGFSSGMNNTARLQGCAARDEILVMDDAIAALPQRHGFAFGERRTAQVKNVKEPLAFRPVVVPNR